MKGFDFMKKTTIIRTMDEKAAFIAENMELTFDRVIYNYDINWEYVIECKCYAVEDDIHGEVIYKDYDEAWASYTDMVEELKNPADVYTGVKIGDMVTIIEVDVSYTGFIKSSDLDITTLSYLFDGLAIPTRQIAIAEVTSDGIVER